MDQFAELSGDKIFNVNSLHQRSVVPEELDGPIGVMELVGIVWKKLGDPILNAHEKWCREQGRIPINRFGNSYDNSQGVLFDVRVTSVIDKPISRAVFEICIPAWEEKFNVSITVIRNRVFFALTMNIDGQQVKVTYDKEKRRMLYELLLSATLLFNYELRSES